MVLLGLRVRRGWSPPAGAYDTRAALLNGIEAEKEAVGVADMEDQMTRAWADEQARLERAPGRRPRRRRRRSAKWAMRHRRGRTRLESQLTKRMTAIPPELRTLFRQLHGMPIDA